MGSTAMARTETAAGNADVAGEPGQAGDGAAGLPAVAGNETSGAVRCGHSHTGQARRFVPQFPR